MSNPLLGQILGGVFGSAMGRRSGMGGMGGGLGGAALGSILAGMLGRRGPVGAGMGRVGGMGAGRGALLMMILPLAMRWVQNNGGVGEVLKRFQRKGYEAKAKSWVGTGANEEIDEAAVEQVVGREELAQMAKRLGVPEQEVAQAFAEIMPEMVNQLTPRGELAPEADEVLADGTTELEREIEKARQKDSSPS